MPLTLQEFLARPVPDEKWIVDELLAVDGGLILHGLPGQGKTLFTLGMVAAISDDEDLFLDFQVHHHGKVIYFQMDMPDPIWNEYLTRVMSEHPMKQVYFSGRWEMPNFRIDVTKKSDLNWILEQVDKVQPIAIVLDVLASIHTADENKPFEMQRVVEAIMQIRRRGCAVILPAHSNKPNISNLNSEGVNGVRGAGNVTGAVDSVIHIIGSNFKNRTLKVDKARTAPKHAEGLKMLQDPKTGLFQVKFSPQLTYNRLTAQHPNSTTKEMMDLLLESGVSKSHAHRLINGKEVTED